MGYLHVTYADIRAMESDAHYDICVLKMLSQWRDTGTEERPRTVRDLLDTLNNTLRPRIYRDLKDAVSGKNNVLYMYHEEGSGVGVVRSRFPQISFSFFFSFFYTHLFSLITYVI